MHKNQKDSQIATRKSLVSALFAAAALCIGAPASGAELKVTGEFGWFGVGKAVEVEKGHFYWVGEFSGTFFNDKGEGSPLHRAGVKCPAYFDADFNNNRSKAGGYCIITDLDGDQLTNTWQNAGTPGPGGRGPGTFEYISGTGKYKGISGKNNFVGVTQVNWADGTTSGYAIWNR